MSGRWSLRCTRFRACATIVVQLNAMTSELTVLKQEVPRVGEKWENTVAPLSLERHDADHSEWIRKWCSIALRRRTSTYIECRLYPTREWCGISGWAGSERPNGVSRVLGALVEFGQGGGTRWCLLVFASTRATICAVIFRANWREPACGGADPIWGGDAARLDTAPRLCGYQSSGTCTSDK